VNCCVAPTRTVGAVGDTEMETIVGVTVRIAAPLTPLIEAVRVEEPAATPVARPEVFTVATAVFELVQLTLPVRSAVVPSLYLPVAVNC
jgi:hypothetical protein